MSDSVRRGETARQSSHNGSSEARLPVDSVAEFAHKIAGQNRRAMARAITLIESRLEEQSAFGQAILEELLPRTGGALRVGITGPPGAGKSTFIEALGLHLLARGHRVAVLAVDPTSPVTGGSILGDKTRMEELAQAEAAFVRPSPSGQSRGGVAHRTREVMLLCEAAGYDVVLIETVGIGQSDVEVASMVDFFLVLLLPAGGDELQGIKRGVMELADLLVVNKADGVTQPLAEMTRQQYQGALSLIRPSSPSWRPQALLASALERRGIEEVWQAVSNHRGALESSGEFAERRRLQNRAWMWSLLERGLREALDTNPAVVACLPELEQEVESQRRSPAGAAELVLRKFLGEPGES